MIARHDQHLEDREVPEINIQLTTRQQQVLLSPAREILYGGAAGGGKSLMLRIVAILYCSEIPYLQAYIFRRLSPDLKRNHMDGPTGFRALLQPWVQAGFCEITENEIRFWNKSKIHLAHCQEESDVQKYQGAEIHLLLMDELTHFTEFIYRYLRSRNRLGSLRIPKQYRHKFPLIVCASNPGSVGHEWVKETFVDIAAAGDVVKVSKKEGSRTRQFIPATIKDNPYLEPDYEESLEGLGSPDLVKALKDGDWNVLMGSFFNHFSQSRHMIEPFRVPVHWPTVCSLDWGHYYPFCVDWWAQAQEDFKHPHMDITIPRLSAVCYRQYYGNDPKLGRNRGLALPPTIVARDIKRMEREGHIPTDHRVADPKIFKSETGVSVAQLLAGQGVRFRRGENKHDEGWQVVKNYLKDSNSYPNCYWFNSCFNAKRNFTNAVRDDKNPMEIKKGCEIHACDTARYAFMFMQRGLQAADRRDVIEVEDQHRLTYGHMLEAAEAYERKHAKGSLEV